LRFDFTSLFNFGALALFFGNDSRSDRPATCWKPAQLAFPTNLPEISQQHVATQAPTDRPCSKGRDKTPAAKVSRTAALRRTLFDDERLIRRGSAGSRH
jgi:hypothetical protein